MVRFIPMLGKDRVADDESEMIYPYRKDEGVECGSFLDRLSKGRHHVVVKYP